MQHLIIVRHGDYDFDSGLLTERGQAQIRNLAGVFKLFMGSGIISIIASPTLRAQESAKILACAFGIKDEDIKTESILESWMLCEDDILRVFQLVKSFEETTDTVVLVTHMECAKNFPPYFTYKEFQIETFKEEIPEGTACVIDIDGKTISYSGFVFNENQVLFDKIIRSAEKIGNKYDSLKSTTDDIVKCVNRVRYTL